MTRVHYTTDRIRASREIFGCPGTSTVQSKLSDWSILLAKILAATPSTLAFPQDPMYLVWMHSRLLFLPIACSVVSRFVSLVLLYS